VGWRRDGLNPPEESQNGAIRVPEEPLWALHEVYRASDTKLGRDMAIKVLPAAFSADAERLRRYEQAAWRAASIIRVVI
jgi:hypothetical protein